MVTIKRVDVVSAMKIAALINALTFTVFGLFFLALNSLIFSSISSSVTTFGGQTSTSFNPSTFAAAGLATCLVIYVIGGIAAALVGAIVGALYAFFYNLIANWTGGLRVELASDQVVMVEKRKVLGSDDEFQF